LASTSAKASVSAQSVSEIAISTCSDLAAVTEGNDDANEDEDSEDQSVRELEAT